MRRMKDSGIEWIGEIPESWEIRKIKSSFSIYAGATPKSDNNTFFDGDIVWVTPADYKTDDKYISAGRRNLSKNGYDSCGATLVPEKSIIFSKRAPIGSVAIAKRELCTNQGCLSCVSKGEVDSTYFYYAMSVFTNEFNLMGTGTTFKEISTNTFANFQLPFPSVNIQRAISAYLDTKCALIDSVLTKTRASIEEYKKLKQSVITQAVTKGVRGDRPMKDSGIEWIGEIPEDWDLCRFERLLDERNEKNSPVKTDERLSLSIDKGITLYADKTTNLDRYKEDVSQYKLAHIGDFVMNSMNMIVGAVGVSNFYGCVSPVYYTFFDYEEDNCYCRFCDFLFHTPTLKQVLFSLGKGIMAIDRGDGRVNTCRLKVSRYDLKKMMLPVPPKSELREIIDYLDSKCAGIDKLIAKKEQLITELERCRKSLIYEYVTGKKEVPVS